MSRSWHSIKKQSVTKVIRIQHLETMKVCSKTDFYIFGLLALRDERCGADRRFKDIIIWGKSLSLGSPFHPVVSFLNKRGGGNLQIDIAIPRSTGG